MTGRRHPARPQARVVPPLRVVLAIDGSPGAALATVLVRDAAWPAGTRVLLVTSFADVAARLPTGAGPSEGIAIEAAARLGLQVLHAEAADALERAGLAVESRIAGGRPADVVREAEHDLRPDVVVLGSRGLGSIERLLLGSTGIEVVSRSRSTVWVARRGVVRRVVLAVDGSTCARRAERLVAAWPLFRASAVTVVAVDADGAAGEDAPAARLAQDSVKRLRRAGLSAAADVRAGDAAGRIIEAATDTDADTIVLGAHGAGRRGSARIGSVARNVVTAGPSVLVVRRPPSGDE